MPAKKKDDTKAKKPATTTKKSTTTKRKTTKKPVAKKAAPKKSTTTRKKSTTAQARTKVDKVMSAVEQQFDQGMADTQKLLKKKVGKGTKETVKNITTKAESVASSVEHFGEEVEQVADSIFPTKKGSHSTFDAQFQKKLSRLFIFRFLWLVVQIPVVCVRSIWYTIVTIIHYIYMFIMGKRDEYLWKKQVRFWKHVITWKSYLNALTDARPEIIHSPVQ